MSCINDPTHLLQASGLQKVALRGNNSFAFFLDVENQNQATLLTRSLEKRKHSSQFELAAVHARGCGSSAPGSLSFLCLVHTQHNRV